MGKRLTQRARAEALESRVVLATAGGVENVLLPEFMAQMADPNGNQLPASDAWWALRSQRNMALDEPISKVMQFGAHNAYNSLNEGFRIVPELSPNQILSLTAQLDVGARLIELDIHDPSEPFFGPGGIISERRLILRHSGLPSILSRSSPYELVDALAEIRAWLDRPENRNEVIFLDFEDATSQSESEAEDPLLPKLESAFGTLIYRPSDRVIDGAWPSRSELIARDKRVIFFTHRNDSGNGRFGVPQLNVDGNGHGWFSASVAFRANGSDDPVSDRGNFTQVRVDEFSTAPSEDANSFFSVQGDSLALPFTVPRFHVSDVVKSARLNVDFMKMDFLFGDDEDADLGSNLFPPNDPFFDIPQDNRIELFEAAVWSWAKNDPAVDRQMFRDLMPGDGTGASMFGVLAGRLGLAVAEDLAQIGAAARSNGRDVAVQNAGRWESLTPSSPTPLTFAARSVAPVNAAGEFDWRITAGASTDWFDGHQIVRDEFGPGFIFAGPVNGFQNAQLHAGATGQPIWINVHDFDRDGNWQVGNRAPRVTSVTVQPSAADEGSAVQLTVNFTDDPDGHELLIDWGDGSPAEIVAVAAQAQQSVVVSHTYRDDHPASGTASDLLDIEVTLTDAGGLSDDGATSVTIQNVAPVIGAFASDTSVIAPADEGEPVNIAASFIDVGVPDTHVAVVDWGDGSPLETVTLIQGAGSGTVAGSHAYAAGGIYTVTLSLSDDDTGLATATTTAVIKGVGVSNGVLFVIGGDEDGQVTIHQTGNGNLVARADFLSDKAREFDLAGVNTIIAYLGGGDDRLAISNAVTIPTVVHGGAGNDELNAGGGPAVLLGDEGDDRLGGQGGRSILIGGTGNDIVGAGNGGDVLIGGSTTLDQDDAALAGAAITWSAAGDYPALVTTIDALLGVLDDGDEDILGGGAGLDLFYDGAGDLLKGVKRVELVLV